MVRDSLVCREMQPKDLQKWWQQTSKQSIPHWIKQLSLCLQEQDKLEISVRNEKPQKLTQQVWKNQIELGKILSSRLIWKQMINSWRELANCKMGQEKLHRVWHGKADTQKAERVRNLGTQWGGPTCSTRGPEVEEKRNWWGDTWREWLRVFLKLVRTIKKIQEAQCLSKQKKKKKKVHARTWQIATAKHQSNPKKQNTDYLPRFVRLTATFRTESKARRWWDHPLGAWKENNCQPRTLCSVKITVKWGWNKDIFRQIESCSEGNVDAAA